MNALVIDIGGNNVKILATGQNESREVSFRTHLDTEADGRGGQETRRRLEV